jgi:hypothetical protein
MIGTIGDSGAKGSVKSETAPDIDRYIKTNRAIPIIKLVKMTHQ